jgi:hypothetical protein
MSIIGRIALAMSCLTIFAVGESQASFRLTVATDPIFGVMKNADGSNTLATVGTVPGANNYPAAENPANAIDGNPATKYLNFARTGVGLIVTIAANGPQATLNGFMFTTANDAPERDPLTITIEGTNAANPVAAAGSAFSLIYSGVAGLDTDPGRLTAGVLESFADSSPFSSFRIIVTSTRTTAANSVQFSELSLIGNTFVPTAVPEPSSIVLTGIAGLMGLGFARRRRAKVAA